MTPNAENYAVYLKHNYTDKEMHDLIGELFANEEIMEAWQLSEEDYFTAIEMVYFAPYEIIAQVH